MSIARDNSAAMFRLDYRHLNPFKKAAKSDQSWQSTPIRQHPEDALPLRIVARSDEVRIKTEYHVMGRTLARQGMWEKLSNLIHNADDSRLFTPGGENIALLLVTGAGTDIVAAAKDALQDGCHPNLDGLADLEEELLEEPQDYARALIAAQTQISISHAWAAHAQEASSENSAMKAEQHLLRAKEILDQHNALDLDSPSLMAAKCGLHENSADLAQQLIQDYSALVEMDPDSTCHMRAFGRTLAIQLKSTESTLEEQANAIALLTTNVWDEGGYTWVYLGALTQDHSALKTLNVARFISGMRDILRLKPDQKIANEFAAYCAISVDPNSDQVQNLDPRQRAQCKELNACAGWLVTSHLRELHPILWYQAKAVPKQGQNLPGRKFQFAAGRELAINIAADLLAEKLTNHSEHPKQLRTGTS